MYKPGTAKRWTVYNNKTDMPVMIYGTARECAKTMGVHLCYFYKLCCKSTHCGKWYIEEEEAEDGED